MGTERNPPSPTKNPTTITPTPDQSKKMSIAEADLDLLKKEIARVRNYFDRKEINMNRYRLENTHDQDNPIKFSGIEMPASKIVAEQGDYLVVKIPGHKYWIQNPPGPTHAYAPAEFNVLRKDADGWLYTIITFPVTERK